MRTVWWWVRMRIDEGVHEVHTLWGSADIRTSLHISLTRGSRGCVSALGIHTHTCESCVGKYYTTNLSETGCHPYDVRDRSLNHDWMYLHLHGPLQWDHLLSIFWNIQAMCHIIFQVRARHTCTEDGGIESRDVARA